MPQSYVALITILGGGPYPDNTLPQPQPPQPPLGIWGPTDPRPTQPIAGWNPGTGTWPTPPQPPLVIWGPGDPRPTLPIAGWNPGTGQFPKPQPPLGTWGGAGQPFPTQPIAEPPWGWGNAPPVPELPEEVPDFGPIDWKYAWTPETGWIVVGIPQGPVPTPSAKK